MNIRQSRSSPTCSSTVSSSRASTSVALKLQLVGQLLVLALKPRAAAQQIYGAVLRGGHEPGAGIIWHA